MLLSVNCTLKQKTAHSSTARCVPIRTYNLAKQMFAYQCFPTFVIKQT
jgi:hypothetical protein